MRTELLKTFVLPKHADDRYNDNLLLSSSKNLQEGAERSVIAFLKLTQMATFRA